MSPSGDILFKYSNPAQSIVQTFGFNMKYYKGHIKEDSSENPLMKLDSEKSETFLPEITSQKPLPYSAIKDLEVIYQQG